ncbi:hypothetical protein B0H12DRAFT_1051085 [Mycena haematopus]|nr:hypothetical protein B0H12DRAFT_1051085 [Mycena haematopus]
MSVAQFTLPMFIGTILSWALFGILLVQVYIYFSVFRKDPAWLKLIIIFVVCLEVLETLTSTRDMTHVFGTGWGNRDALDDVGWAWFSAPVMGSISEFLIYLWPYRDDMSLVAFVCQVFYGWRIYNIGKSRLSSASFATIALVASVQLAAGIWTGVEICRAGKFSLFQSQNLRPTATWLAMTSVSDLLIVCCTIFFLRNSTDPEFTSKRTNSLVSRLILITVQTGGMCMLFALVNLFLFVTYKGTNYHLAVCIELSKIYSNSILLILNSRAHMGHECNYATNYSVNLSSDEFRTKMSSATAREIGV